MDEEEVWPSRRTVSKSCELSKLAFYQTSDWNLAVGSSATQTQKGWLGRPNLTRQKTKDLIYGFPSVVNRI